MACFPGNHFGAFRGKHVLYRFDLPAKSVATITLRGKSRGKDLSLYTYRAAVGEKLIPPEIYGTQCEASYGEAIVGTKPYPGVDETLEMVSIANPYSINIGVAGYKGVSSADFELTIDLTTAAPPKTGPITKVLVLPIEVGKRVKVQGKINDGVEIDLGWAETSNVSGFGLAVTMVGESTTAPPMASASPFATPSWPWAHTATPSTDAATSLALSRSATCSSPSTAATCSSALGTTWSATTSAGA